MLKYRCDRIGHERFCIIYAGPTVFCSCIWNSEPPSERVKGQGQKPVYSNTFISINMKLIVNVKWTFGIDMKSMPRRLRLAKQIDESSRKDNLANFAFQWLFQYSHRMRPLRKESLSPPARYRPRKLASTIAAPQAKSLTRVAPRQQGIKRLIHFVRLRGTNPTTFRQCPGNGDT
jgi:hypothetical protein